MGRYDGVSYALSLIDAYSPGVAGSVMLTVAKDRNGGVGVKGKPMAEVHFMPAADNRTIVSFRVPEFQPSSLKPLRTMAKIMELMDECKQATKADLRKLGKSQTVDSAIELLEQEGRILRSKDGKKHVFNVRAACTYRLVRKSA